MTMNIGTSQITLFLRRPPLPRRKYYVLRYYVLCTSPHRTNHYYSSSSENNSTFLLERTTKIARTVKVGVLPSHSIQTDIALALG